MGPFLALEKLRFLQVRFLQVRTLFLPTAPHQMPAAWEGGS